MPEIAKHLTPACNLDGYRLTVNNHGLDATVFWARVVSSENESLLTGYTKHTFFEIQYALEGRIVITVGDNTRYTLDESDFIVIPPDTYHQIVDGDDTGARFIMAFSLEAESPHVLPLLTRSGSSPHRDTPALRTILALLLEQAQSASPFGEDTLSCLTEAFLWELLRILSPTKKSHAPATSRKTESGERVRAIREFIQSYHGVGISVSSLARRFGISERHLNRIFQAETRCAVREVINHEKLCYIEELVASTALSLGEVSALCGFSDEYAMNKFFKRYNKIGLSEYRRTAKHGKTR